MGAILVIATAVAAALYYLRFGRELGLPLTKDPSDWGAFGDYMGGLLNPLISLFAFYWLGSSVRLQVTQLEESSNAMRTTMSQQEHQAKLTLQSQKLQALNLELTAVLSDIGHHQAMLRMWLEKVNGSEFAPTAIDQDFNEVPIMHVVAAARGAIRKLRGQERALIDQIRDLTRSSV